MTVNKTPCQIYLEEYNQQKRKMVKTDLGLDVRDLYLNDLSLYLKDLGL